MRISDWSSDVCSSDLPRNGRLTAAPRYPYLTKDRCRNDRHRAARRSGEGEWDERYGTARLGCARIASDDRLSGPARPCADGGPDPGVRGTAAARHPRRAGADREGAEEGQGEDIRG